MPFFTVLVADRYSQRLVGLADFLRVDNRYGRHNYRRSQHYAWRHAGTLYTASQHVAAPLTYDTVNADLRRILTHLVVVAPAA